MNHLDKSQTVSPSSMDVGVQIFVSPAATLGICLMVFGVLHAVATGRSERLAIDGLLALNASLYVAAALLANVALRRRKSLRGFLLSGYANHFFVAGLGMTIVGICCLVLMVAIRA